MKKKVFMYVGHSNWGKSKALKVLTNNSQQRTVQLGKFIVSVKRMSNDDIGKELLKFVNKIPTLQFQRFVLAFCPKKPSDDGNLTTEQNIALEILTTLKNTNEIFFFVQEEKYNSSTRLITQQEIDWLKEFGTVHILKGQNDDVDRASKFKTFITKHI